jgi:hypothetical protein
MAQGFLYVTGRINHELIMLPSNVSHGRRSAKGKTMMMAIRAWYRLAFKLEAVQPGQSIAPVSKSLGLFEQTLLNWIKAHREGTPRCINS